MELIDINSRLKREEGGSAEGKEKRGGRWHSEGKTSEKKKITRMTTGGPTRNKESGVATSGGSREEKGKEWRGGNMAGCIADTVAAQSESARYTHRQNIL